MQSLRQEKLGRACGVASNQTTMKASQIMVQRKSTEAEVERGKGKRNNLTDG